MTSRYNQALLLVAVLTLSATNGNTIISVSRSLQSVRSVDSFTVLGTSNSPCNCEGFGGVSSSHNNWTHDSSICICRCLISKPTFSYKIKGASPKCVKDQTAVLADHAAVPVVGGVRAAAQRILTTPGLGPHGEAVAPFIVPSTVPVVQGTGSTSRPTEVNILLIAIIASVVSLCVVIIIAVATWLYFREKKVRLVRQRSRDRSRSSQGGSSMRRSEPAQVSTAATVHKYEYVDERPSNGPRNTVSLPRTYNPTFDVGADDCVFIELPSVHQQGLTRPWSVAGYSSLSSTGLGQVSKSIKPGYQHLLPLPSVACGCPNNNSCAHSQPHKPRGGYQHLVYNPVTKGRKSKKTSSTGKIDVTSESKTGYQRLIYGPLEHRQREHSVSSPPQCDIPYQPLKASHRTRSEPVAPNNWLPSFGPDYQHLRYKKSFAKGRQGKKRVDSSSDGPKLLCRLSQSESCIVNLVWDTGVQEKTEMRPRSASVGGVRDSGDETPLSPDDLRTNYYQALARQLSSQQEPHGFVKEEDCEIAHIYHRCGDTELGGSDNEEHARAELLTRTHLIPVMELDGSDSEGYARPELITRTRLLPDGSDSEGYARPELLTSFSTRLLPAMEPDGSDSEGYARPELIHRTRLLPATEPDGSDSEGYARPELITRTRLLPAMEPDGSDSEGYARPELIPDTRLLPGSLTREDPEESSDQPDYMTLEETFQTNGTESTCNRKAEENDSSTEPEYMILDTTADGNEAGAVKEETGEESEDEVIIGSPEYMVLESGNPDSGQDQTC